MGEYAGYNGQSIKIGTCESMYYLRADQAHLVTPESGSVDPIRDAASIRFRFPFPEEDGTQPGDFEDYSKSLALPGLAVPDEVSHYSVQFTAKGYNVSLPCPESVEGREMPHKVHRNGFSGAVRISQQRVWEGRLVLVNECGGCGSKWRCPELADAADVLGHLATRSQQEARDENWRRSDYFLAVAQRIVDGYNNPPAWVKGGRLAVV